MTIVTAGGPQPADRLKIKIPNPKSQTKRMSGSSVTFPRTHELWSDVVLVGYVGEEPVRLGANHDVRYQGDRVHAARFAEHGKHEKGDDCHRLFPLARGTLRETA